MIIVTAATVVIFGCEDGGVGEGGGTAAAASDEKGRARGAAEDEPGKNRAGNRLSGKSFERDIVSAASRAFRVRIPNAPGGRRRTPSSVWGERLEAERAPSLSRVILQQG